MKWLLYPIPVSYTHLIPTEVEVLDGFNELDEAGLKKFIDEKGLAMDLGDIKFCQEYFRSEKRDPTITEIKICLLYTSRRGRDPVAGRGARRDRHHRHQDR